MKQLVAFLLVCTGTIFGQEQSLLYQIKAPGKKTSYIFGTIHVIPDSLYAFSNKLEKIISKSDEIILEIADISDKTKAMKLLAMPEGKSCFDIFTQQQKDSVLNWGAALTGITPAQFETSFKGKKPFVLMQLPMQKMMMGNIRMYEREIELRSKKYNIPLSGLETMEDQISIFDRMESSTMAHGILDMIHNPSKSEDSYIEMLTLYKNHDLSGLAKVIENTKDFGESIDELLTKRNLKWIPKIDSLTTSKSCFIAVGAGHLAGNNGVINLLKEKGYEVIPVKL